MDLKKKNFFLLKPFFWGNIKKRRKKSTFVHLRGWRGGGEFFYWRPSLALIFTIFSPQLYMNALMNLQAKPILTWPPKPLCKYFYRVFLKKILWWQPGPRLINDYVFREVTKKLENKKIVLWVATIQENINSIFVYVFSMAYIFFPRIIKKLLKK